MRNQPNLIGEPSGKAGCAWLHRGVLLLVLGLLAAATWRKWGDPLVDFGCELYVPWQITQGKHLYRDMAWLGGPLAQYGNALAFALAGVSFTTLIWVNLALLALLTELIRSYFARCISPPAGLVAGLLLLVLFGFGQYVGIANYNYIAPYRHEQTRGLLLAIGALGCATQGLVARRTHPRQAVWWMWGSGVLFGGVWLTKLEMVLATSVALGGGLLVSARRSDGGQMTWWRLVQWFALGAVVLPSGFLAYLSYHMPLILALRGMFGNLATIQVANPTQQAFYQHVMGFDAWTVHVSHMAIGCGLVGGALLAVLTAERWLPRRWHTVAGLGVALIFGWLAHSFIPWAWVAKPFPVLLVASAIGFGYASVVTPNLAIVYRQWLPLLVWNLLALALLARLGPAAQLHHYGFTLAMPAFLLLALVALFVLPDVIRQQHAGTGRLVSGAVAGFLVACTAAHVELTSYFHEKKTQAVGVAGDRLLTYGLPWSPVGAVLAETVTELSRELPPNATLLVMPEGITLNYWLRRENPTTFLAFDPYYLAACGGELAVIAELERRPPDFIALTRRDMSEYGVGWFGEDPSYGRQTMAWVSHRYEIARVFGEWEDFGVVLLRRRDKSSSVRLEGRLFETVENPK